LAALDESRARAIGARTLKAVMPYLRMIMRSPLLLVVTDAVRLSISRKKRVPVFRKEMRPNMNS
jgi:hypothetical protein